MRQSIGHSGRRRRARLGLTNLGLTVVCMFALSGCFLQSIVGRVDETGGASLSGNVEVSFCNSDTEIPEFVGCTYTIFDDNGFLVDITSTFQLVSEFGFFGVIIDPLILQVPADTTNVVATFNNAGSDDPMLLTETTSFSVTPAVTVNAEPGTRFLIIELPDAAVAALPAGPSDINFSLSFDTPNPANLFVKAMLTASVDQAGTRYYVPVMPCVTDFASIPAMQIPVDSSFQFLNPTFAPIYNNPGAYTCNYATYDFNATAGPTCASKPVTIDMNTNGGNGTGTAGADVILGTPGADTILGLGGADTICAEAGSDLIRAGAGADIVRGGPGADRIFGGGGADDILGGPGADTIFGEDGSDNINGGGGPDLIDGGAQSDIIRGQGGSDVLSGGDGPDTIDGFGGADQIFGGGGVDDIRGQNGGDQIMAGPGSDQVAGQTGADTIFGEAGDDDLFGGNGNDLLYGGSGFDTCSGNSGLNDQADAATCEQTPGIEALF